jgi:hypothetical protein
MRRIKSNTNSANLTASSSSNCYQQRVPCEATFLRPSAPMLQHLNAPSNAPLAEICAALAAAPPARNPMPVQVLTTWINCVRCRMLRHLPYPMICRRMTCPLLAMHWHFLSTSAFPPTKPSSPDRHMQVSQMLHSHGVGSRHLGSHIAAHTASSLTPSSGTVLLAISEWTLPVAALSSNPNVASPTTVPDDMLSSCHEILAAHARGVGGDLILRLCGLSRSLGHHSDDALLSAASFASLHDANNASVAIVMQARWHAIRVVFHEIMARIVKRDARRRCRQVS